VWRILIVTGQDIKDYYFCPYTIYVRYVLGFVEHPTDYMLYGSELEKERHISHIRALYKPARVLYSPLLEDVVLGLIGRPDYLLVLEGDQYVPVEVKWAEPRKTRSGRLQPQYHHVMQLAFYAFLVERSMCRDCIVRFGLIYYLRPQGKVLKVPMKPYLKKAVLKAVDDIRSIVEGKVEPSVGPSSRSKCRGCSYRSYCPYGSSLASF